MLQNEDQIKKRHTIVNLALKIGVVKAEILSKVSRKTISKWVKNYQQIGIDGLRNASRKMQKHPNKMPDQLSGKISEIIKMRENVSAVEVKQQLQTDYSLRTIQKKINLIRSEQPAVNFCHSINVSIKKLNVQPDNNTLPGYIIKAHEVSSGIIFISYSYENSLHNIYIFIDYLSSLVKNDSENVMVNLMHNRFFTNPQKAAHYQKIIFDKYKIALGNKETDVNKIVNYEPYKDCCISSEKVLLDSTLNFLTEYNYAGYAETNRETSFSDLFIIPIITDKYFAEFDKLTSDASYWNSRNSDQFELRKKYLNDQFAAGISLKFKCLFEDAESKFSEILFYANNYSQFSELVIRTIIELSLIKSYIGDLKQSDYMLETALNLASIYQEKMLQYRVRLLLMRSYIEQGRKYAVDLSVLNREIFTVRIANNVELAYIYIDLGFVNKFHGNLLLAKQYFHKAYNISLDTNNKILFCNVALVLADYYFHIGNAVKELLYLNKAEKISIAQNLSPDILAHIYYSKAHRCVKFSDYLDAKKYISKAINEVNKINHKKLKVVIFNISALIKGHLKEYDAAVSDANYCIALSRALFNNYQLAISYNNLGLIYKMQNKQVEAINYFNLAIKLAKSIDNIDILATFYGNLSYSYNLQGNYLYALKIKTKEYKIVQQVKNSLRLLSVINDYACIYHNQGNDNKALIYLNKTLQLSQSFKNDRYTYYAYNNIAYHFYEKKQYEKALHYYNQSIVYAKKSKSQYDLCCSILDKCDVLLKLNLHDEAVRIIKSYYQQANEAGNQQILTEIEHFCAENQILGF